MTLIEMPKANENLTEATLDRWLVNEGDTVRAEQGLCGIITDKAQFDLPSPVAGVVLKRYAPERGLLPVGYVLLAVGAAGEALPADVEAKNAALLAAHKAAATAVTSAPAAASAAAPTGAVAGSGVRATPVARRLAKEAGVELADIAAALKLSGPVNEKDVKAYLEKKK
jgi:pyruvate dehydrogenase E2 component (dihydrolipoamide acetyltransferase)